jgi:DNA-binding CsgD family transcriptional regulator
MPRIGGDVSNTIDASVVLPVIGRIYDAALDASLWPDVVQHVIELQGANKGMLFTPLHVFSQGGFNFRIGMPESAIQQWADKYAALDVWAQAAVEKGLGFEGNVMIDADLVPQEALRQTVFYKEYLSRFGIERVCTGMVFGVQSPPLLPAVLAVYRDINGGPFGQRERALHGLLIPHISRALGIMFRLRDADLKVASTLSGFDRLASGVVLLGANGVVVFANRAARRVLQMEDGLRLRNGAGGQTWLAAEYPDAQQALNAAIAQCVDPGAVEVPHFANAVRIERPSGGAAFSLNFSALPEQNEFGSGAEHPKAILFLNDPDKPVEVDAEVLKRLYSMTAAECRLASRLCDGDTLAAIAERLNLSENTVKSQLKSIFDKTGTRRQAQLVKLLVSLASSG